MFIDDCEENWNLKSLYYPYVKSSDCLNTDDEYSVLNTDNLKQPIQMQLYKKVKRFCLRFWNLYQVLDILKKRLTLIAYVFSKIRTTKDVIR